MSNTPAKEKDQTAEIEALKAQIAALTEKVEKPVEDEKLPPLKADPSMEEYVEVFLFYDGKKYKDDVFVAVNGETCLIQRGKPVKIKKKFKLALDASQLQDNVAAAEMLRFKEEYEQKKARLV